MKKEYALVVFFISSVSLYGGTRDCWADNKNRLIAARLALKAAEESDDSEEIIKAKKEVAFWERSFFSVPVQQRPCIRALEAQNVDMTLFGPNIFTFGQRRAFTFDPGPRM